MAYFNMRQSIVEDGEYWNERDGMAASARNVLELFRFREKMYWYLFGYK